MLQAPQRVLDRRHDPAARAAAAVGVLAHRHEELGRQDDVVAAALERLADDLLGLAGGVDVGGVDEVDAGVERGVDDADRVVVVGVAPGAEHHRAEAELRDLDAGASERAVVHGSGLRDVAAEGLERDAVGLRAAALAGVERVDRGQLVGGRARSRRRRSSRRCGAAWSTSGWRSGRAAGASAASPAPATCRARSAISASDRVVSVPRVLAVAVERDAADRRPRLGEDAVLRRRSAWSVGLREVRVQLDLVDRRDDVGAVEQPARGARP